MRNYKTQLGNAVYSFSIRMTMLNIVHALLVSYCGEQFSLCETAHQAPQLFLMSLTRNPSVNDPRAAAPRLHNWVRHHDSEKYELLLSIRKISIDSLCKGNNSRKRSLLATPPH